MMKIKIFTLLFLINTISLKAEFHPWQTGVKTGDQNFEIHNKNISFIRVYSGVQGGAFFMVRFFQVFISSQDGPNCRHVPVCSAYARHSVVKHGSLLGSFLAGDRLLRCNPFYPPERDPVPDKVFQ